MYSAIYRDQAEYSTKMIRTLTDLKKGQGSKYKPWTTELKREGNVCTIVQLPPKKEKDKENKVKSCLDKMIADGTVKYQYKSHDKGLKQALDIPVDGKCSRYRPDFLFDLPDYVLILEVDERMHCNYDPNAEEERMEQIREQIELHYGKQTKFIRMNPSKYKTAEGWKNPRIQTRMNRVAELINSTLTEDTVYLYYS